jgi:hypothetical protein
VGAVHRLPPGDELEEEDAEREHVRLLVNDAVREVLGRQAPVVDRVSASTWLTTFSQSPRGKKRCARGSPERALDGRDGVVRPLRRQPPGQAEVRNLHLAARRISHICWAWAACVDSTNRGLGQRERERDHYYRGVLTCGWKSSVSRMLDALMSRWMIRRAHPLWR